MRSFIGNYGFFLRYRPLRLSAQRARGLHSFGHRLRDHGHLRRLSPHGLSGGRHHPCVVRRAGHRLLSGTESHCRSARLRRSLGARHRMGGQPRPHPRGFGHRHHLVGRHGARRTLHEPASGLHVGRSGRIPLRQHRDGLGRRRRGAGRAHGARRRRRRAVAASGNVRRLRPRIRPQPGHRHADRLLSHGGPHGRHHRACHPRHGHRAAHLADDRPRRDDEHALEILPHDRLRLRRARRTGRSGRPGGQLPVGTAILLSLRHESAKTRRG